jgi:hypothetical protein
MRACDDPQIPRSQIAGRDDEVYSFGNPAYGRVRAANSAGPASAETIRFQRLYDVGRL